MKYTETIHGRSEKWNFSSSAEMDIELNIRCEIPYLQATMYYFVYYTNALLTRS